MNKDEEEKLRQERIELLKLKQGIISESELIPETSEEPPEITVWQKAEAFFDLNKGFILLGVLVLTVIVTICVLLFSREAEDLMVLVVITDENSPMKNKAAEIEKALEMYCPDFDNNGSVHVNVSVADISVDAIGDFERAQNDQLSLEIDTRYRQLIISDGGFMEYISKAYGKDTGVIMEGELSRISLNSLSFARQAGLEGCPDDIMFFIRCEMNGDPNTAAVQRERALEVMNNIVDNKAVSAEG
ncbi:MAG: hypothetical protein J1F28_01390 [Oscillospiraceae bacterium]|nr:hypothetical protein [Oscillospiraceae bacterium]